MEALKPKVGPSEIALLALAIALSQLGVRETIGNLNTGPMVDRYLRAVGLGPGYAWCQAFVNWCYEEAAKQLGVPEPVVNTGGVMDCWRRTVVSAQVKKIKQTEIIKDPTGLLPGDQGIMKIGTAGAGHTFLITAPAEKIKAAWWLHTIEGNTNDVGDREGYEVAKRKRRLLMPELQGVIRYS